MTRKPSSHVTLSKPEFAILDALPDGIEPVEEVIFILRRYGYELPENEFLETSFNLYKRGFIAFLQEPITAFGQAFPKRQLSPQSPSEIVGDLQAQFQEVCATGDYILYASLTGLDGVGGVPIGIYYDLTDSGRAEWKKPMYRQFWPSTGS